MFKRFKIYKIQNSVYYANCESFKNKLYKKYGLNPLDKLNEQQSVVLKSAICLDPGALDQIKKESENSTSNLDLNINDESIEFCKEPDIILDVSAINYVDTDSVKMFSQLIQDFGKIGVSIYICQAQGIF